MLQKWRMAGLEGLGNGTQFVCPAPLVPIGNSRGVIYETGLGCAVPCPTIQWTDEEWDSIVQLLIILSAISVGASLLSLAAHLTTKRFLLKMFASGFCLVSLSVLLFAIANLDDEYSCDGKAGYLEREPLCVLTGTMSIFGFLWVECWAMCQAFHLYLLVVRRVSKANLRKLEKIYVVPCTIVCIVLTATPLIAGNVGFDPESNLPFCLFLKSKNENYFWFIFFTPMVLLVVTCLAFMIRTVYSIHLVLSSNMFYWTRGSTFGRALGGSGRNNSSQGLTETLLPKGESQSDGTKQLVLSSQSKRSTNTSSLRSRSASRDDDMDAVYGVSPTSSSIGRGYVAPNTAQGPGGATLLEDDDADVERADQSHGGGYDTDGYGVRSSDRRTMPGRSTLTDEDYLLPNNRRWDSFVGSVDHGNMVITDSMTESSLSLSDILEASRSPFVGTMYRNPAGGDDAQETKQGMEPVRERTPASDDTQGSDYTMNTGTSLAMVKNQIPRVDTMERFGASSSAQRQLQDQQQQASSQQRQGDGPTVRVTAAWLPQGSGSGAGGGRSGGGSSTQPKFGVQSWLERVRNWFRLPDSTPRQSVATITSHSEYVTHWTIFWKYNKRTVLFVLFYGMTTCYMVPLLLKIYHFEYDSYYESVEDFSECLMTKGLVDQGFLPPIFDPGNCGSHPKTRPEMWEYLSVIVFISFYGVIPLIIFGLPFGRLDLASQI